MGQMNNKPHWSGPVPQKCLTFLKPLECKPGGESWLLLIFPGTRALANLGAVLHLVEFPGWALIISPCEVKIFGGRCNAGHNEHPSVKQQPKHS